MGKRTQKLGPSIAITIKCGATEDCLISAKGNLSLPGAASRHALRPARRRTVRHGTQATLKLNIPATTRVAATRALRRHKTVGAIITVTIADAAGNTKTLTRTIKLIR